MESFQNKTKFFSLTEIIHQTFHFIKKEYKNLFTVTAAGTLLSFLLVISSASLIVSRLKGYGDSLTLTSLATVLIVIGIIALAVAAVGLLSTIVVIEILAHSDKQKFTFTQALYHGLNRFWPMVGLSIIISLLFVVAALVGELITSFINIAFSFVAGNWIDVVFFFTDLISIFIIIFVSLFFMFAPYYLVADKLTVMESVKKGIALVKGRWWAVFFRIFFIYILIFGLGILIRFIPYVGSLISAFLAPVLLGTYIFVIFQNLKQNTN